MANTVSRRFVFVKMKRKRPLPKPRPERPDDQLVGESARPSRPLLAARPRPLKRKSSWPLIAAAGGGLLVVAGAIAVFAGMGGRPPGGDSETPPQARRSGLPTHPGYARSASAGYPGRGGGSGGNGATRAPATAENFLAAPFPKRKPTSCAVQVDGSKESLNEFSKCIELANASEPPPAGAR